MVSGDFELSPDELRAVVRFAITDTESVLPVFEDVVPDDPRPRHALAAARAFADGAPRGRLQRETATQAHRAARDAPTQAARLAARSAGDAAAAAYLHPIARATQFGHVLRAAASRALIAELQGEDPNASLARSGARAGAVVVDVLRRYPPAPDRRDRVAVLMRALDERLRS